MWTTDRDGQPRLSRMPTRNPRPHHCDLHHDRGRHATDGIARSARPADPRACRPRRAALSRNHAQPGRPVGIGCRHTAGLEDVWSARHAGKVPTGNDNPDDGTAMDRASEQIGASTEKAETAPHPDDPRKPDEVSEITKPSWKYTAKCAVREFNRDQCTDLAAALTYYSVLALFPGLLALVSLLGVFGQGQDTVNGMLELGAGVLPAEVLDQIRPVIDQMVNTPAAGFALVAGLAGALWSASGYVNAFGRAMNRVYDIDEGRPIWKLRPVFLVLTLAILLLISLVMIALVVSGPVARWVGDLVGLGDGAVAVWDVAKLPVVLLIVGAIIAMLYHFTPNVRQPKFRWLSVGAAVAILAWVIASIGFGFYVGNFGSYNKTYGALAGVIVFLLWLWITNLALLLGAEVDAELERARQLQAGIEAEETLQLPPRDDRGSKKKAAQLEESIEEGRRIRLESQSAEGAGDSDDHDAPAAAQAPDAAADAGRSETDRAADRHA